MSAIRGFKGYIGVGQATTGSDLSFTAVARNRFARYLDAEITQTHSEELDPFAGRREHEEAFLGPFDARLRATIEGTTEGPLGMILQSLMGSRADGAAVSGATPHTFTSSDSLASANRLTFEKKFGTKAESQVANGVVSHYRYDFSARGAVRQQFDALLALPTYNSSPTSATYPSIGTRLSQYMHTFTFRGSSVKARSGFVDIDAGLWDDDYDATSRARRDAEYGLLTAQTELEFVFADMADLRAFWDSASATTPGNVPVYYEANIKGEHPTVIGGAEKHTIEFDMDRLFITEVGIPIRGRDVVLQRVRGTTTYDATNGTITVKTKNTQATV